MKNFLLSLLTVFLIGFQLADMNDAHAMLRGVASGSSSTGCTGTSVTNGVVYTTATPNCQSDSGFTYNPATSSIILTGGATVGTSVTVPIITGGAGNLSIRSQGASTDAATVTNNLFTFAGTVTVPSGNCSGAGGISIGGSTTGLCSVVGNAVALQSNGAEILRAQPTVITFFEPLSGSQPVSAGSYVGNSNGISPTAGNIGQEQEFSVASTGAVVTVSSATPVTIVSSGATVTAGDYDVSGIVCLTSAAATSFTTYAAGISTSNNTLQGLGTYMSQTFAAEVPGTITAGTTLVENCQVAPTRQVKMTTTGTIYLVARPVFSVTGSITGYGQIFLRRRS